jgi:large subunit ribosomal protein L9
MVQPIERLGKAGQIVNVAPGYARNRLIPNMLALPAIDRFVIMVQNQIKVNLARSILVEWILS